MRSQSTKTMTNSNSAKSTGCELFFSQYVLSHVAATPTEANTVCFTGTIFTDKTSLMKEEKLFSVMPTAT